MTSSSAVNGGDSRSLSDLRFAPHSPGSPVGSARIHRMSCGDVECGVHVSVSGETTGDAAESRLALSRLRRDMPARRASLARIRRVHLLHPAGSLVLRPGRQQAPSRPGDLPIQPGRPALSPGKATLEQHEATLAAGAQAWDVQQFARGQGGANSDAAVYTHDLACSRTGNGRRDRGECDVPAARAVAGDPVGLRFRDRAPRFAERRTAVGSPEKPVHRLVEVAERLLLHGLAAITQPAELTARLGELAALLQVAGRALPAGPPPRLLLDGQVLARPSVRAVRSEDGFLLRRWSEPVAGNFSILSATLSERGERRFLSGINAGVSAPRFS